MNDLIAERLRELNETLRWLTAIIERVVEREEAARDEAWTPTAKEYGDNNE